MERRPRISIVTPSFNQAKAIVARIESVMGQDYPTWSTS
jgi:glycosyltransferase involved in cell wall biosynthesis